TASAGISTAVRKRKAKISMRLRRARAFASLPTSDMREFSARGWGVCGIRAAPVCTLAEPWGTCVDVDQGMELRTCLSYRHIGFSDRSLRSWLMAREDA